MTSHPDALAIKQENVLLIGPYPEGSPLRDPSDPTRLAAEFKGCNIALVMAWPGFRTPYPDIARLLHARGIAFSLLLCGVPDASGNDYPSRSLAAFFPIEDPSPCWRCLELRWLGWVPRVAPALAWLEALQFPDLVMPYEIGPPTEEERVMLSWTAMDVIGSDAGVTRLVYEDGTFDVHRFLPHPQCAWCSPWSGIKAHPDVPRPSLADLVDPVTGLFQIEAPMALPSRLDLLPVDGPDGVLLEAARDGWSASSLTRHAIRIADGTPYFGPDTPCHPDLSFTGKGDMPTDLFLDALSVYAMRLRGGRPLWRGTRRGVALTAPNPRDFIFPLIGEGPGERRYADDLELDWARAHDLQSGDVLGIPADLVFSGSPRDRLAFGDETIASAHTRLTVAVRWALSRVAENDALMATWHAGLAPPRVLSQQLPAPYLKALLAARDLGMQLEVLDLTTDIGIPVIALVGRADGRWFYGCAASWQPLRALRAAWVRLGQSFVRKLPDPGGAIDFLFEGPLRDFPSMVPGGDTDPIDTWRYVLDVRGMQALWIDITPPDVALAGIVVARAWIAGALPRPGADVLLDLDPDYVNASPGGGRLLELPMRMGLSEAPLQPEDLNTRPHPFV